MTAPPQPAAPAPRDAGAGERVSVDAAALQPLEVMLCCGRDFTAAEWRDAAHEMSVTVAPIAPAPGAGMTAADALSLMDAYDEAHAACVVGYLPDSGGHSPIRARIITALASATPAVPVVDRAAVEEAEAEELLNALQWSAQAYENAVCGGRDKEESGHWSAVVLARAALRSALMDGMPFGEGFRGRMQAKLDALTPKQQVRALDALEELMAEAESALSYRIDVGGIEMPGPCSYSQLRRNLDALADGLEDDGDALDIRIVAVAAPPPAAPAHDADAAGENGGGA